MNVEPDQHLDDEAPVDNSTTAVAPPTVRESAADEDAPTPATPESRDEPVAESENAQPDDRPVAESESENAQPDDRPEAAREPNADAGLAPEVATPESRTDADTPLLEQDEVAGLLTQWRDLQVTFVDSPRAAVTQADELVGATIQHLSAIFAERKQALESRWSGESEDPDTERMRQALRGYRALFNRLLAV